MSGEVKRKDARSRSESESEEGVLESDVADEALKSFWMR